MTFAEVLRKRATCFLNYFKNSFTVTVLHKYFSSGNFPFEFFAKFNKNVVFMTNIKPLHKC